GGDPGLAPRNQRERQRRVEHAERQEADQETAVAGDRLPPHPREREQAGEAKEEPQGRERDGADLRDGDLDPQKGRSPDRPQQPEWPHSLSLMRLTFPPRPPPRP